MVIVGFTGTSRGMNQWQRTNLREFLVSLFIMFDAVEFRHGWCIGADDEAAVIAKEVGCRVVAHPGYPKGKPGDTKYRGIHNVNDVILPEKEFVERDHDIVDVSNIMIAAPHGEKEVVRSGTWTTVRYARKLHRSVTYIWPTRRPETIVA